MCKRTFVLCIICSYREASENFSECNYILIWAILFSNYLTTSRFCDCDAFIKAAGKGVMNSKLIGSEMHKIGDSHFTRKFYFLFQYNILRQKDTIVTERSSSTSESKYVKPWSRWNAKGFTMWRPIIQATNTYGWMFVKSMFFHLNL